VVQLGTAVQLRLSMVSLRTIVVAAVQCYALGALQGHAVVLLQGDKIVSPFFCDALLQLTYTQSCSARTA
jgi:hypothetical protein